MRDLACHIDDDTEQALLAGKDFVQLPACHRARKWPCPPASCAQGGAGRGYGPKLMAFAEQLAAERGMAYIFALSTQTYSYLQQKSGFVEVTPKELPEERRKRWQASARNSKILRKPTAGREPRLE